MQAGKRSGFDIAVILALLAGNLLVIAPWLGTDFSSQPWNNDYAYIAIARMFRDRPWTWNGLQYAGAPFPYAYPPLMHVLLAIMPVHSLGRAFHLLTGLAYSLIPVSLYVLCLALFRSRLPAIFAAVLWSVLPSPVYYVLPQWGDLARSYSHAPWPFVALIGQAEAGHTFSVPVTLLAIAAAWRGRWAIAGICAGAVFLTNWPGIIGLLMALAALAVARSHDLGFVRTCLRTSGVAGVAYGLSAFWMTPGFFRANVLLNRVVFRNEQAGAGWGIATWLVLIVAAALLTFALWRRIASEASFLLAWLAISGVTVVIYAVSGDSLLPVPHRYVMEFSLALILALAWVVWRAGRGCHRVLGTALILAALIPGGWDFLRHAWRMQPRDVDPGKTLDFQISDWLARNAGSSRILASGELEGSLNIWANVAQAGGSRQGVSNPLVAAAHRQVTFGCAEPGITAQIAELWLRALDVRYLVLHDAHSHEHFHWFAQAEKFDSLPIVWANHAGDTIRGVPPPEQHSAVVVDLAMLERLPRLRSTADREFLEAYVAWAQGVRPARIHWSRPHSAEVDAALGPGEGLLVKVNYDRGWHASAGQIRADPIGFLLIDKLEDRQRVALRFGASWDVWLGRVITVLTIVLLIVRAPLHIAGLLALAPALAAYAILALGPHPPGIAAAEDAFRRLKPPLINPGGIVDGVTGVQPPLVRGRPLSIYGLDFGSERDAVRVWIGGREARILYRGPNQLNVEMPGDAPSAAEVAVEVNGCRGNAFVVATRD